MENYSIEDQITYDKIMKKVKAIKGFYRHLIVYIVMNAFILLLHLINMEPGEAFFT